MSTIYDQHRTAFANVEAHVIVKNGQRVATVAFKYPRDGAGRLYAYVHWLGTQMERGYANGYGYDKRTAACASACSKIKTAALHPSSHGSDWATFWEALAADRGPTWDSALRSAGFEVWQAV